jgi:hypothetical protein
MSCGRKSILAFYLAALCLSLVFRPYETPGGLFGPGIAYTASPILASEGGEYHRFLPEVLVLEILWVTLLAANLFQMTEGFRLRNLAAWCSLVLPISIGLSVLLSFDSWRFAGPFVLLGFVFNRTMAVLDLGVYCTALTVPILLRSLWRIRIFG